MYQAIRAITAIAFVAIFLTACGGTSSGESTGGSDNTGGTTTTTNIDANDPNAQILLSGAAFYQDSALACMACHGPNGDGTVLAPDPINSQATCPSCTDVATLAAEIVNTMPPNGNEGNCVGSTPGTCAYDIAFFIMDQWIANAPPPPTPGIGVIYPTNPMTDESGATETITLSLETQPTADVNIGFSSSNVNEGTVSTPMISFNATNWDQPQSVIVTGVDDGNVDGNIPYTIEIAAAVSADTDYNGINPDDVVIVNNDNDVPIPAIVNISQTSGLITDENGVSATVDVALNSMPTVDVVVNFASSNLAEGTVAPASLTFTSANYSTLQTVTITGVDDMVLDGNVDYMITTSVTSADPEYGVLNPSDISVTNNDNEVPPPAGVSVNPDMGLITAEVGAGPGPNTFTVVLQSMPTADVTIGLTSSATAEGTVNPSALTFTMADWNIPQTVTVTGVDDAVIDGNVQYTIITGDPASADAGYDALTAADVADVTVTNLDDDAFLAGKAAYELAGNNCVICHGASGEGTVLFYDFNIGPVNNMCGVIDCLNEAELTTYLEAEMPPGNEANCDATCASNIAKYMLNNFSVTP